MFRKQLLSRLFDAGNYSNFIRLSSTRADKRRQLPSRLFDATSGGNYSNFIRLCSTRADKRLEGKVALITGAASGIGKATASEFVKNGAKVMIADIQDEMGQLAATQLGSDVEFIHCDVTDENEVADAVVHTVSKHGHLDIMYNNAGIPGPIVASIVDMDLRDFDHVMSINLRGALVGMKHAAKAMIPRKQGCILCTASITGLIGGVAPHPYSISKFAVPGLVKAVASELSKHGIRVNCISPYAIATPFALEGLRQLYPGAKDDEVAKFLEHCGELKGAKCDVEDIARAALYLSSEDGRYITGHNLVVDGGFSVIKPFGLPTQR